MYRCVSGRTSTVRDYQDTRLGYPIACNVSCQHLNLLQVFGRVVHILPGADAEGSLDHVDYYLFCMRALAGKKPMQTLFTADGTASVPTVRFH